MVPLVEHAPGQEPGPGASPNSSVPDYEFRWGSELCYYVTTSVWWPSPLPHEWSGSGPVFPCPWPLSHEIEIKVHAVCKGAWERIQKEECS